MVDKTVVVKVRDKGFATYDFTTDADGANPAGWVITESANATVQVIASLGGQTKVVELYDNDGAIICAIQNTFSALQTSGVVELKIRTNTAAIGKRSYVYLYESTTIKTTIEFRNAAGTAQIKIGAVVIGTYSADQWYWIRITFDCATDTYYVQVREDDENGTVIVAGTTAYDFLSVATTIDSLKILTKVADSAYYFYIDDVDYSWTTGIDHILFTERTGVIDV